MLYRVERRELKVVRGVIQLAWTSSHLPFLKKAVHLAWTSGYLLSFEKSIHLQEYLAILRHCLVVIDVVFHQHPLLPFEHIGHNSAHHNMPLELVT